MKIAHFIEVGSLATMLFELLSLPNKTLFIAYFIRL